MKGGLAQTVTVKVRFPYTCVIHVSLLHWTVQAQLICINDNSSAVTIVTVHCLETTLKIVQF